MDVKNAAHMVSVEVTQLDMSELDVGQTVEIVTDKGTFWAVRTIDSAFHGQEFGAVRMAIWGTDFTAGDPKYTKCMRLLTQGKVFTVQALGPLIDATIEHILLPAGNKH